MSMALDQRLHHVARLRHLPGLQDADAALLEALGTVTDVVSLRPGDTLVERGEQGGDILVVLEGRLRVGTPSGGRHVGPGATIGWLELLADRSADDEIVVERSGRGLLLSADGVLGLLEDPDCPLLLRWLPHLATMTRARAQATQLARHLAATRDDGDLKDSRDLCEDFVSAMVQLRRLQLFARADVEALTRLARGLVPLSFPAGARPWAAEQGPEGAMFVAGTAPPSEHAEVLGLVELLDGQEAIPPRFGHPRRGMLLRRQLLVDVLEDHPSVGISIAGSLAAFLVG